MHILAPHISCIVAPHELAGAIEQGYKEIYIITVKGTFKHHILRGENRHIRVKVDSIPGYKEEEVTESVNFLPAGKIPYALYETVQAFFRKVMEVKNSEVEAMIHILYNAEQGYHLGVPPQTISKASVSYDWSYIPQGTSIIVDIHSHNTMGAFFSGTDDRDDIGNISFSGVFGKLKDKEPMTVWRFNYYGKKFTAKVADIFEDPVFPENEIPAEWLDKVRVTAVGAYGGIGSYNGYQGRLAAQNGGHSNRGNVVGQHQHHSQTTSSTQSNHSSFPVSARDQNEAKWRYTPPNQQSAAEKSPAGLANGYIPMLDDDDSLTSTFFGGMGEIPGYKYSAKHGHYIPDDMSEVSDPPFGVTSTRENPDDLIDLDEEVGLGKSQGGAQDSNQPFINNTVEDPAYEAIAITLGVDVADAWWSISTEMTALEDSPELIEELIKDMLKLTSEDSQYKIISAMFEALSEKNQEKIQTNGFA